MTESPTRIGPCQVERRRWQVSVSGGQAAAWSDDGSELFDVSPSGSLMVAAVEVDAESFEFRNPEPLFQSPLDVGGTYGVYPSAEYFVFSDMRRVPDAPIAVILNWQQLLEEPGAR